ncbi:MAG TPA: hypothetical protein VNZ26_31205, partial [Vicinamibacterales bacterium]|nr:hypothetical protein [Vicinamibacterales bacterium]
AGDPMEIVPFVQNLQLLNVVDTIRCLDPLTQISLGTVGLLVTWTNLFIAPRPVVEFPGHSCPDFALSLPAAGGT